MSDRDRLQHSDPKALRAVKERIKKLRADPRVAAAFAAADAEAHRPTIEALRSGYTIQTYDCRITYGTLTLLDIANAGIVGGGDEKSPLVDYDIALAIFLMADETRNLAISIIDDPDLLKAAVEKFARTLNLQEAGEEVWLFFKRTQEAFGSAVTGGSGRRPPGDWWADNVDLFCSQYHWSLFFVLWELPYTTAQSLLDSMEARLTRKAKVRGGSKGAVGILKAIDAAEKDMPESSGDESDERNNE